MVFCLVDLVRRPQVTGGRKWVWAVVIVLFNLIGSIVYLAFGRAPAPVKEPPPAPAAADRVAAAADLLYGPPQAPPAPPAPSAGPDQSQPPAPAAAPGDVQSPPPE